MFEHSVSGDLLGDLEAVTKRLTADQRSLAREVARTARKALIADVRATRGTLSFSGMGTKLGARTRVVAGALTATVYLDAVPAGAWAIVEHGRAASRAKKAEALYLGGGVFAEEAAATRGRGGLWFGAESSIEVAVLPVLEEWAEEAVTGG